MNALVLSGGGGKGAYQIGVWKALRKLHYKVDIVTGTSVGCLNALMVTQNNYLLAPFIWNRIDFSEVFKSDIKKEQTLKEMLTMYGKNIIKNKGMDTQNLEKKIDKVINYKKFYNSKVDFGLVTYNLSNFKPKLLTKKQIPKDKLKSYVMASATCFPAFKMKDIDGDKYIDGGYYDVLPINLAIDMGATDIVAVDLKSFGIRRIVKNKKVDITYIYPKNNIGNMLLFDKKINKKNIKYGYNDTMKTFGKLEGHKYTFKKNTMHKINKKYTPKIKDNMLYFLGTKASSTNKNILSCEMVKHFIENTIDEQKELLDIIEKIGKYLELPCEYIYSINKFNKSIKKRIRNITIIDHLKINTSKKEIVKYLYFYMTHNNVKKVKKLAIIYKKEFICAIYLYTIVKGVRHAI